MSKSLDRLHGGPAVKVEPHHIPTARVGSEYKPHRAPGWYCSACDEPLVYGRDGKYRHRRKP